MHLTRQGWLAAAHGATWFRLDRHDDPEPNDPPAPEPDADPDEPEPDPEGADKLGDEGKRALDKMKADKNAARKAAAAEKKRADDLARKVAEFEDRDKSELEKAQAQAERAAERAAKATARAVKAEVKAAAGAFADPDDAAAFLDLTKYAGEDGEVDTDALTADLTALLERKPHLRRQDGAPEPEPKKVPKPDPSQGPRKEPAPVNYADVPRDELKKKLAEFGVRLRS